MAQVGDPWRAFRRQNWPKRVHGRPALIVEEASEFWQDLGERWYMLEQYYKPYPVCRWAQASIEAALDLQRTHGFTHHDVTGLEIETFHEAIRQQPAHLTPPNRRNIRHPFLWLLRWCMGM